jgi:acyl dehydratase
VRYWEDFQPGDEAVHGTHTMTEEEILAFAHEYDPQPIHVDREAAAAGPFGGLIASGWQTTAIYMGLFVRAQMRDTAGMGSPGVEELRWLAPVRAGDVLTARSRILETWPSESDPGRGTIVSDNELVNQDDIVVMRFRARMHIARRLHANG